MTTLFNIWCVLNDDTKVCIKPMNLANLPTDSMIVATKSEISSETMKVYPTISECMLDTASFFYNGIFVKIPDYLAIDRIAYDDTLGVIDIFFDARQLNWEGAR